MNSSKTLFMCMMIVSTMMVISSMNWMNMWIGLEMNMMSMIPLMSENKNSFMSQSSMSYFLIQSLASMLFIMSMLMNKFLLNNMMTNMLNNIIILSMMIKLGMPPFHQWFPEIMNKMKWTTCFMMTTWQKIAPLYILSKVIEMNKTYMLMIITTTMIGAISGLNQTSTRKIISYSSINHLGWLIMLMMMFKEMWMMYMVLYSMMMMMICVMMYMYNIMYINQMKSFSNKNYNKMMMISTMLSMGGMPPFLGFLPKMMAINYMIQIKEFFFLTVMILSSVIIMYYYLKMSSTNNLLMANSQKWMKFIPEYKNMFPMLMMLNYMLPTMMLIMF